MAIWQFVFDLAPRSGIEKHHGTSVIALPGYGPVNPEAWDENKEFPKYWEGYSPQSFADRVEALLPPRKGWGDALMFGDDAGDDIQLWEDSFLIRLDIRNFNVPLARHMIDLAMDQDLMIIVNHTGRLITPTFEKLVREIRQSRAAKFVGDPMGTIAMIAREHE